MKRTVTLTDEQLTDLVKKAYEEGVEDGDENRISDPHIVQTLWEESATKDNLEQDIEKWVRG